MTAQIFPAKPSSGGLRVFQNKPAAVPGTKALISVKVMGLPDRVIFVLFKKAFRKMFINRPPVQRESQNHLVFKRDAFWLFFGPKNPKPLSRGPGGPDGGPGKWTMTTSTPPVRGSLPANSGFHQVGHALPMLKGRLPFFPARPQGPTWPKRWRDAGKIRIKFFFLSHFFLILSFFSLRPWSSLKKLFRGPLYQQELMVFKMKTW